MELLQYLLLLIGVASGFSSDLNERIVGGHDVDIKEYPYQLSLRKDGAHHCGASIISAKWALTASSCVDNLSPHSISFRAGSTFRTLGGSIHNATKIWMHPRYNNNNFDYNFALVEVMNHFPIGLEEVKAIFLATNAPADGANVTVSGWGTTTPKLPDILQATNINIVSHAKCSDAYGSVTSRMICAGGKAKDSCDFDVGGPLVKEQTQVGIVSHGYGCAQPGYPKIYSNIADQRDWIRQVSGM